MKRPGAFPIVLYRNSPRHIGILLMGVVIAAAILLLGSRVGAFEQGQLTLVMIYAIAIAGLNLVTGYSGLISVGHAAFFGLGAYTTGVLITKYGWSPGLTLPVAVVACFIAGLIVGLPALRIRGLYLAMVTLAFGMAFPELVDRFGGLTGGAQGLEIPFEVLRPPTWTGLALRNETVWLYWFSAAVLIVVMMFLRNIVHSRYGLSLTAVRDNEFAAASSGVNRTVSRTIAFGLSGAVTGVGGSLFAIYLGSLVADSSFNLSTSILLLTGLFLGGQATLLGPIVGGVAVVYIPYYTSNVASGEASAVMFGVILIAIIFFVPEGIVGGISRIVRKAVKVTPRVHAESTSPILVNSIDTASDLPI